MDSGWLQVARGGCACRAPVQKSSAGISNYQWRAATCIGAREALVLTVSCSLRYDKNSSQLTPIQNLGLWKSIVLPHFLQNLRYIHSDTDIKKMQTSLNLSLV